MVKILFITAILFAVIYLYIIIPKYNEKQTYSYLSAPNRSIEMFPGRKTGFLVKNTSSIDHSNTSGTKAQISTDKQPSDKQKKCQKGFIFSPNILFGCMADSVNSTLISMQQAGQGTRQGINTLLSSFLDQNTSALVMGMVFGGSSDLPATIKHKIKVIGISHVVSASGYNVAIVMSTTWYVFSRFCRPQLTALGVTVMTLGYLLVAGLTISLLRAAIMGVLSVWAGCLAHRKYRAAWGLGLSVLVLMSGGWSVLTDVSFQLSIGACLGIVYLLPLFHPENSLWSNWQTLVVNGPATHQIHWWDRLTDEVGASILVCLTAQALTLPIILWHFGELSLSSVLANPLLLWLTPLITMGGLGLVMLGWLSRFLPWFTGLALVNAWLLERLVSVFLWGVSWLAQGELGFFQQLEMPIWIMAIWYGVLLVFVGYHHHQCERKREAYDAFFIKK